MRDCLFGVLVEMIRLSDTSCRAFRHQIRRFLRLGCYFGVRQKMAGATKLSGFGLIDTEDTKLVRFCLRLVARLRYVPWFSVKGPFPQGSSCSSWSAGVLLVPGPDYKAVREEMKM